MTSRILGALGRFFITTGIVILLFVGYQLWGTGLQEASAQNDLESEFDELLETVETTPSTAPSTTSTTTTSTAPVDSSTTTVAASVPEAGGSLTISDPELAAKLYREGGQAIARMSIPAIDVGKVVVAGVSVEDLRNGPGHYSSTVFPGQVGNSGVAGHRTTYGAPFNRIDELLPGDEIRVRTVQGDHVYRVMPAGEAYARELVGGMSDFVIPEGNEGLGHIIVGPEATWVLGNFGDNRITLTACHPKYSARERIIVAAELVTTPVDAPPPPEDYEAPEIDLVSEDVAEGDDAPDAQIVAAPDDGSDDDAVGRDVGGIEEAVSLDEGLNGDESALRPAILWGLAAIAVYLGFKELGRRWRRWPAIALGIAPVVLLMGLSFEKIDRWLPAG